MEVRQNLRDQFVGDYCLQHLVMHGLRVRLAVKDTVSQDKPLEIASVPSVLAVWCFAVSDACFDLRDDGVGVLFFSQFLAFLIARIELHCSEVLVVSHARQFEVFIGHQGNIFPAVIAGVIRVVVGVCQCGSVFPLGSTEVFGVFGNLVVVVSSPAECVSVGVDFPLLVEEVEIVVVKFDGPPGASTCWVLR